MIAEEKSIMKGQVSMDYELIAKALFENYETIYDINLETNGYISFHESEAYKRLKLDKSGDDFFEVLPGKIAAIIAPGDQEYVLNMLAKENLIKGLEKEKYYSFVYRIMQDGKEVYHQIRATFQRKDGELHVFMGVRNIENIMRQEQAHRSEIRSMQQKDNNHMQAVLASAAAYMEANLTKDIMLEKSDDALEEEKRFISKLPSIEDLSRYSEMHAWICDHIIARSREEYNRVGDREYLLECFRKGELRTSVAFSVYTKDGDLQSCREVFFLYQETTTLDVCAFCVVYDLTEQQKEAQERELLERELQMSRLRNFTSQMQPHFLYNTLGSVQEVILTDPEYASELLESFTLHLRSCIRAMTKDEPQPFLQELENIKAYVNIEKMRFGDKLRLHYEIECTDFMILPLTIQPLVENAVRHGIYGRGPAGGDVYIRSREEKTEWIVQIEDTGVGFDVEEYRRQQGSGKGDSTGIRNIRFRLEKIMGASLELQSRKGKGTTAVVHIPKEGI